MLVLVSTNILPLIHVSVWVSTWILTGLGLAEAALAAVRKLGWFGLGITNAAFNTLQSGIAGPTILDFKNFDGQNILDSKELEDILFL